MSRFSEPQWLSPALPVMAVIRLGSALGFAAPTMARVLETIFLTTRMPRALRRYQPDEHDVFITCFSKSGTNWAMQIAQQLAWHGRAEFDHIHDVVPWPEARFAHIASLHQSPPGGPSPTGLRVIKTHLPATLVPYDPRARYITVLRDPKAVMVSAYYFVLGVFGQLERISFDQWYEMACRSGPVANAWANHAASYWAWRDRPNVLVLTYAEMKDDLSGTVRRFAEFMGLTPGDEVLAEVTRRASFEYMKAHESQFCPPTLPLRGTSAPPLMMRRGQARSSNELMTPARQAELDQLTRARLRRLGCDLPYDELFGSAANPGRPSSDPDRG